MLDLDGFLCFSLETGGLFIGWFFFVTSTLWCILSSFGLIFLGVNDCSDLQKILGAQNEADFDESCGVIRSVGIFVCIFLGLINLVYAIVGRSCIKGTSQRNPKHVRPMVILLRTSIFLSLLNVLTFNPAGMLMGVVYGGIYWYLYECVSALHTKLTAEFDRSFLTQHQMKAGAV